MEILWSAILHIHGSVVLRSQKNVNDEYIDINTRVSHKKIEFFLFGPIFRWVSKKVEGFYF